MRSQRARTGTGNRGWLRRNLFPVMVRTLSVCAVAALLAGCSGATLGVASPAPPAAPAEPGGPGIVSTGSGAATDAGTSQGVASTADRSATSNGVAPDAAADQQRIVKTGTLEMQVRSLDAALLKARAAIEGLGGYVSASDQADHGGEQIAAITYRVPAAAWDQALDALRPLASKIVAEKTQAVEVTGQVLDLGARIDNLRVTERALQAIMARATKISDVLEVQAQLTSVRGQIEQLSTQKAHLEQQAALGTLTVTYEVPVVAVTAAASGWDPGHQFDGATAQLVEIAQFLASVAIWAGVVVLPLVGLLVLVFVPLALIVRRTLPHRASTTPGELT